MLNPRLAALTDYPFRRLDALIAGAEPPDGITRLMMSLGEPQGGAPTLIAEIVAAEAAGFGKYPAVAGTPDLRRAIAAWATRRYGLPDGFLDPETSVLAAAGTREALFATLQAVTPEVKDGARPVVLMPNPFYQVYAGGAVMAGAEPVFVPATAETGFQPDLAAVSPDLWRRASAAIVCSPANPQGTVLSEAAMLDLIRLARAHDAVLIADECYSEIWVETPPPGLLEVAAKHGLGLDNLLVMNSLSKRSGAPGLRAGFIAGDPKLIAGLLRMRTYSTGFLSPPLMAAATALWADEAHVEINRARYRASMAAAERILGPAFGWTMPAGGFFAWADVGDGEAAARRLWAEAGVKVLPGAYLSREGDPAHGFAPDNPGARYVRIALVHAPDVVEEGLTRIARTLAG
ncbi:aminotransferase class I/II-fold pyridoxal phosphate-dependent enzyme [Tistrella mobilis]|uniref:aminotransferase class I/II-fold pyridoxal phosphate-dependent enzyme n=1 Tax=Tistrella mobilis TaxID=171437 RepID=UPI00355651B3